MNKENPIRDKSYTFAVKIVGFCKKLHAQKDFVLSKQLLRTGTSIGANVEEALQAQRRKDFISKLCIALKEAYETKYWLRLLRDAKLTTVQEIAQLLKDIDELMKLLTSIIKTSKLS